MNLIPNGSIVAVTNETKELYLNALASFHLQFAVQEEIEAFRSGLTSLIPAEKLAQFDENELEVSEERKRVTN